MLLISIWNFYIALEKLKTELKLREFRYKWQENEIALTDLEVINIIWQNYPKEITHEVILLLKIDWDSEKQIKIA